MELNKIYCEDCLQTMKRMPDNFVDSIVTDPPYGLKFMGKKWDYDVPSVEIWKEVLRVLKPGGHLLSFGGTRTYHRMVCAIEDAGFEIRDQIQWIYGSGFPKSLDISKAIDKKAGVERKIIGTTYIRKGIDGENNEKFKQAKRETTYLTAPNTKEAKQWEGWGTALKPANEPICVARKPLSEKTVAENILKWGTGGINVDGCRVEYQNENDIMFTEAKRNKSPETKAVKNGTSFQGTGEFMNHQGRFPSNVIHDGSDEVLAGFPNSTTKYIAKPSDCSVDGNTSFNTMRGNRPARGYDGSGSAARFFYCAKSSKSERGENNNHPTVKPIKIFQYLQRLVTPKGGLTYDPFGGSGTSARSASNEGFKWILSEIAAEYCDIANKRVYNNSGLFI